MHWSKQVHANMRFGESEIGKYLAGEMNQEERQAIETWINENPQNKEAYLEYKDIWALPDLIVKSKSIDVEKASSAMVRKLSRFGRKRIFFNFLQRAAAILFIPVF